MIRTSMPRAPAGGVLCHEWSPSEANDEHLRGALAHELAHDDLGHVAKAQALGAGLGIGMIILDQIPPGGGRITPIAGHARRLFQNRDDQYADLARTDG